MKGMLRSMSIIYGSIIERMGWLSAQMHELAKQNWLNKHVSKQFDVLERARLDTLQEQSIFSDQAFTMNMFNVAGDDVPEFIECMQFKDTE